MSNYLAHDRNFFYFEGSYKNYWIDDFYGAIERENNKVSFKTSSTCDDGGSIGGSGGSYNPDLIDENNSVTWTDSGQIGYTRPSGSWNHYGGTGGYDLQVDVRDVSTGRTETATVNSLTSGEIFYNNGTATIMTHQVYGPTDEVRIITEKSGSNPNGPCEIKRITSADGYTTFDVSDCFTVQQLSSQNPTKAVGDCPVDDGEVGVIDNSTRTSIIQKLGLLKGSPEYGWLYGELNTEEIQQVNNLDLYLDANTTTEAIFFGFEALRAIMHAGEVAFKKGVIIDPSLKDTCVEKIILDFIHDNFSIRIPDSDIELTGLINKVFDKLAGSNPDFTVTFKSGPLNGNGSTSDRSSSCNNGKCHFTIILDSDLVDNGSILANAKTILHEGIHAYLQYRQIQEPMAMSSPSIEFDDLIKAWNQYNNLGYAHHVYLGELVNQMGQQLNYYAEQNFYYPTTEFSYSPFSKSFYYQAVAWSGIAIITDPQNPGAQIINPAFHKNHPLLNDQTNIINIFSSENTGTTVQNQSPIVINSCN